MSRLATASPPSLSRTANISAQDEWDTNREAYASQARQSFQDAYLVKKWVVVETFVGRGENSANPYLTSFSVTEWWAKVQPCNHPAVVVAVTRAFSVLIESSNVERVLSVASALNRLQLREEMFFSRMFFR
jgi:predicted ATP-grasp superfamily ATP-dependent carboligase